MFQLQSLSLSLSCAHARTHARTYARTHARTHTHTVTYIQYALAEQSPSFTLIHTHTDVAFACLWQEVFCRLSEESSLLLPPAGNTSLFIDQGLAGWRERTEKARDEEKWEKGEKMLQLWSKCCTEPLCVMENVMVNGRALSFIYTAQVILFSRHRFWPVLSYTRHFYIHITMLLNLLVCMLLLEAFASNFIR